MKSVLLLFKIVCVLSIILDHGSSLYTHCGGLLEAEKGIIQTPNFPSPFPTPINCAWVIHNPHPEKKIILYFTQYFLKNSFHLSEYDEYISEHDNKGIKYLGEMNYINQFSSMAAYKPFLVIRFKVRDMGNMHLRVEEFLKDVYGFNITYEVVNKEQNIKEACSAHNCSFLGHCVANSIFSDYKCQCFPTFFGDYCQYGPFCDPSKGKNMCQNDGQCRYFMGSLVNVCDCTDEYRGDLCQEKKHEDLKDNDCKLGCSHDCERAEDGEYFCFCGDGFRLASDNTTCVEKEMYRISAEFPLKGVPYSSTMLDMIIKKRLKTFTMIKKMRIMGLSTATRLKYDTIRTQTNAKVMMFHFYVETAELSMVNDTIQGLITHGRFMNITVDLENIKYFVDPEMKLLYVENYDKKPAVEGKLLTLACTARGSSNMGFRWYKDGYLVNVSVSDRNAWEVRIPRTMKNKQMSVLNIDGVTVYDKGEFTCNISDFGQVQYKSVMVDVITYPHIEVTPLAASRELGQSIGFRCVTPDDTRQTFDYRWYKNGVEIISDHGDEIIEELIPAGSRLAVRRVTSDANYTCYITNTAGTSNLTAHVFLLPGNKTNKICESEKYEGVKWKRMGAGNFDIERCPTDTGGYSRRMCECKNSQCQWSQPNFAKCQSGHLVVIYDRLEKLRLGYQHDNMSDIFDTLYKFIKLASTKMLAGDVDVSCYILHTFIKTIWQFPIYTPQSGFFSYQSLMEVLDLLLQQAINSNHYEQKDLYVAPKIIDISMMLSKIDVHGLQIKDGYSIQLAAMGFRTGNLSVIPANLQPDGSTLYITDTPLSQQPLQTKFKTKIKRGFPKLQHLNQSESHSKNESIDEVEVPFTDQEEKKVKLTVQFYFKKLFPLMKVESPGESISNPVSDVYSIYLLNGWESNEERLEIFLPHNQQDQHLTVENDTRCVRWNDYRMSFYGYWDDSGCETINKNLTTTTCWCRVPGTFAVFIKPEELKNIEEVKVNYDIVLLVGCILSLCGLSATIIVYLFTWRKLVGNVHCIHLNLTLSLAIVNILCLMCLGKSSVESVCVAVKILLQFFYIATFAFMFVESVHMFVSVHGGNRMTKTCIKYFLIGWGIPTVSTGCVVIASEKLGYDKMCTYWCWLTADHWHYYSFLIPMIVLILAQVGLTVAGFVSVYHWTEEWRYSDRKQYIFQGIEMMIIQLLLTICCITGSKILQNTQVYSFVFIFSDISLSFVIFLFYCVLNKQKFARSSFRSFMLPEKVNESRSIEQTIQDHHNAVNKRKYTAERKRQLRFLVGSSSHYSGSSNSASTTVSGSGSGSDGPIRYKANSDNVDSGFSEETGSEQNCLVELHPLQKGSVKEKKSGDSGSKDSYILADPASPSELSNLKEVNTLPDGNEPLIQTAPPKIVKNTRFVFATDGSNDPLLNQPSALIH